jgi:uncharacterized membrane protein HdeD (DUF308 family)
LTARAAGGRGGTLPWWLILVEGIIAAFLGFILLIAPGATLVFLVQLLGLYLFVAGIFRIVGIFLDSSSWGWRLLSGVLSILAGLLVLDHPLWSALMVPTVLVFIVGFLSILQGAAGLVVAFQGGGWSVGTLAVLGILFGLLLVIYPVIGVATLPFVLGFFMLVGGIGAVVQALRMR